ncbi:MAG: hypothetical protein D6820_07245, partial [Lentisphaerae bacterium]
MKGMMIRLLDWMFGTHDTAEILDLRCLFHYQLPLWLGLFLLIGIGYYCYRIYLREAPHLSRLVRHTLAFLRFVTYVILLVVILKPILKMDRLTEPRSNLAILVDSSKSMSIVEKGADENYLKMVADAIGKRPGEVKALDRHTILKEFLNRKENNLIRELARRYSLRFYGFDQRVNTLHPDLEEDKAIAIPKPEGEETHVGSAIRHVVHDLRGHPLAGVIMFTDGGNNGGENPEVVAKEVGKRGIRLFPVGIGVPGAVDIKVVDFDIPDLIFKDEDLPVEVTFEGSSVSGNLIQVDLYLGDEKVAGERIEAKDGRFRHTFIMRAKEVGDYVFKVMAEEQPNEYFVQNNVKEKRIKVIDNAIRVLFVIENPCWEYRYLKGMLDQDKRVDAKVFIRRGDPRRAQYDPQYLDRIPFERLNRDFDCLVMTNIRADYFDQSKMEKIRDFVAKDGGSLIMISATSGTPGTYAGTPIGEMLPVRFRPVQEDVSLDFADRFTRPFGLKLTREGRYHPITRLHPLVEENERLWERLPPHYWYYTGIKRLKPSAIALVEHSKAVNEYGPIPLIATHRFGKGQVLF